MIVKTLLAAIVAGLIAGVFMTAAQQYRTVPLILHAEEFESGGEADHHAQDARNPSQMLSSLSGILFPVSRALAHDGAAHEEAATLFGMGRFVGTLAANLVTGAGFGLLLAAASILIGHPISAANGVFWGAAGWLTVHLLPAIGLPPELPGFPAADLADRQVWWSATVIVSAVGLHLVALRPETWAKVAGLVLIAGPHVVGAPYPDDIASDVPALLAAEFAVAALATALAFWLVLGLVLGQLTERFGRPS